MDRGASGTTDYACRSSRPEVIEAATTLEPGQLVGIIGAAPKDRSQATGFDVERLELLGRKARQEAA